MSSLTVKKYFQGRDASNLGAFPCGERVKFSLEVARELGVDIPLLRAAADGEASRDFELSFVKTDGSRDFYEIDFDPSELLSLDGLIYYSFVLPNEGKTLYTNTYNNVDFSIEERNEAPFLMLLHLPEFKTPEWFGKTTMYQIFVDRFCRGEGEVEYQEGCTLNEDWYNGVPQYGAYPGAPVSNTVFFGGNLWGVTEKLEYLASLGVGVIYLNPIFEARSNHKYDIGDYLRIDAGFGGEAAFEALVKKANELGIKIILDGVFNHTGDDSLYFDRYGRYGSGEKYKDWYCRHADGTPECWWGIEIMPRLDQTKKVCRDFFTGDNGVARKYIKDGIAGWRLDVADELCDEFLDELREAVKDESNGEAVIIGEVWENAAEKVSYGKRRKYLRGLQLDSVMNYPLRNGLIDFAKFGDAEGLYNILTALYASYPRCVSDSLMNIVGTHDTERILTVLGGEDDIGFSNDELAKKKMTAAQREKGKKLLKLVSTIQYTVYGIPSLYYGDEAGIEGYHDPFCRLPYPWGSEDSELVEHYKCLGKIRTEHESLNAGDFRILDHDESFISYERKKGNDRLIVAANRGGTRVISLEGKWSDELTGKIYENEISIAPETAVVLFEV